MKLTREIILKYSNNGAWTYKQLNSIGVTTPPKSGWMLKVIGTEITEEQFKVFSKEPEPSKPSNQLNLF